LPRFAGYCPFQIDGNMGHAAAIGEMLLQSHVQTGRAGAYELELLPALPAAWPEGSVRGLRARGGFEVDLAWKGGVLTAAAVKHPRGGACLLRLRGKVVEVKVTPGQVVAVDANLEIRRP
jgi:alpha-L-fucosidase 2